MSGSRLLRLGLAERLSLAACGIALVWLVTAAVLG
jgi:hypothetical protein